MCFLSAVLSIVVAFSGISSASGPQGSRLIESTGSVSYQSHGLTYLHTEGKDIKNEFGETVYLRGCTKMCMQFETYYDLGAYNIRESDFENIKNELGVNVVRIDLALSVMFPTFDLTAPDARYVEYMDNIVNWSGQTGMYVLLDLHGYYPNLGAPSDFWDTKGKGIREPYRSMIGGFWVFIANRYKGNPTVFGFDLYNELWNAGHLDANRPFPDELKTMTEEWIDAINAVNPKLIYLVEGTQAGYGQDDFNWVRTFAIDRPNVVYSPHLYPEMDNGTWKDYSSAPFPGNTFCQEYEAGYYAAARTDMEKFLSATWAEDAGYPIFVGEFGLMSDNASLQCLRDCLEIMNAHGWSWTYWGWCGRPPYFWLVQEDWITLTPQGEIVAGFLSSSPI